MADDPVKKAADAQRAAVTGAVTAGGDTMDDLRSRAATLNIEGRSSMSKEDLRAAIDAAQSGGVNRPRELNPWESDPKDDPTIGQEQDNPTPAAPQAQTVAPQGQGASTPAGTGTAAPGVAGGAAGR